MEELFKNINWSVFWEAASAIATTAAVIVALWQTRYVNKKKVKLSFIEKMTIIPHGAIGSIPKNQYVGIEIVNTGNRKLIIDQFWIELPENYRAVIQPDSTPAGTVNLPVELDIEQSVFLPWKREKFLGYLRDEKVLLRNQKLVFCISDSTGVIYKCKTNKTVQQYIDDCKK